MNYFDEFIKKRIDNFEIMKEQSEKHDKAGATEAAHTYCILGTLNKVLAQYAELHKQSHIDLLKAMPCQCNENNHCDKHRQLQELEK